MYLLKLLNWHPKARTMLRKIRTEWDAVRVCTNAKEQSVARKTCTVCGSHR